LLALFCGGINVVVIELERTYLTTAEGHRVVPQIPARYTVDAESPRNALLEFVTRENGRVLGSVTEADHRAVCTGWACGRLYVLVAQELAAD
jgi:hypothetical protein